MCGSSHQLDADIGVDMDVGVTAHDASACSHANGAARADAAPASQWTARAFLQRLRKWLQPERWRGSRGEGESEDRGQGRRAMGTHSVHRILGRRGDQATKAFGVAGCKPRSLRE